MIKTFSILILLLTFYCCTNVKSKNDSIVDSLYSKRKKEQFYFNQAIEKQKSKKSNRSEIDKISEYLYQYSNEKTQKYLLLLQKRLNINSKLLDESLIEIRFWSLGPWQNTRFVFLKYNQKWISEIGEFKQFTNSVLYRKSIDFKNINLTDSIISFDVLAIKSIDLYDEQLRFGKRPFDVLDGNSIIIEILTPNSYRLIDYNNPEAYAQVLFESKDFQKFYKFYNFINKNTNKLLSK